MQGSSSFASTSAAYARKLRRVATLTLLLMTLLAPLLVTAGNFAKGGCNAQITPSPAQLCPNSSVNTASGPAGATSYAWSIFNGTINGASNGQFITYAAGSSGNVGLTLSMTHPGGNSSCGNINVPIARPAAPTITPGGPTTFCLGASVTLTSGSAGGNQWYINGNPIGGETQQSLVATTAGNYTVVTYNGECESEPSASISVTVTAPPPTPAVTPSGPTTFCAGGDVTLTASFASGFQWFNGASPIGGATGQNYIASDSGSYHVVTLMNGCYSSPSSSTFVTVNPLPNATISAPAVVSSGGTATASVPDAGFGAGYVWFIDNGSFPGAGNTPSMDFIAGQPGTTTLDVFVNNPMGCGAQGSASVQVSIVLFANGFE